MGWAEQSEKSTPGRASARAVKAGAENSRTGGRKGRKGCLDGERYEARPLEEG